MTPKDKAYQIWESMYMSINTGDDDYDRNASKACAIVAVEAILTNFDGLNKPEYCAFDAIGDRQFTFDGEHKEHLTGYDMQLYWIDVLYEIEKL